MVVDTFSRLIEVGEAGSSIQPIAVAAPARLGVACMTKRPAHFETW